MKIYTIYLISNGPEPEDSYTAVGMSFCSEEAAKRYCEDEVIKVGAGSAWQVVEEGMADTGPVWGDWGDYIYKCSDNDSHAISLVLGVASRELKGSPLEALANCAEEEAPEDEHV